MSLETFSAITDKARSENSLIHLLIYFIVIVQNNNIFYGYYEQDFPLIKCYEQDYLFYLYSFCPLSFQARNAKHLDSSHEAVIPP